jgi:ribonuclease Z
MIKITFLGTGSAVPTAKRNHPSILLNYKEENILFDCGEGTQRQFRYAKINPCKITRLFISHWHGDHVLGIPGLLQTLMLNEYNKTLQIYGPKDTKKKIKKILSIFEKVGNLKINIKELTEKDKIETSEFIINTKELNHGTPCLAYSFREKDKLRINKEKLKKLGIENSPELKKLKQGKDIKINGKKINHKDLTEQNKGKKITLIFDTKFNTQLIEFAKDSDMLISEATYLDEEELAKEHKHQTIAQATTLAKESNSKKLVLFHLSQRYEKDLKEFSDTATKKFKNSIIAKDLMEISV